MNWFRRKPQLSENDRRQIYLEEKQRLEAARPAGRGAFKAAAFLLALVGAFYSGRLSPQERPNTACLETLPAASALKQDSTAPPEAKRPCKAVHVHGYFAKSGKAVAAYDRTCPDDTDTDNWSHKGNKNPETGTVGTKH